MISFISKKIMEWRNTIDLTITFITSVKNKSKKINYKENKNIYNFRYVLKYALSRLHHYTIRKYLSEIWRLFVLQNTHK